MSGVPALPFVSIVASGSGFRKYFRDDFRKYFRYASYMATDPVILDLRRVKRLREAADAAQKAATDATEPAIVAALEAGMGAARIASESGVSDSHVRAVRRKHDLPANPSYAHLKPGSSSSAPEGESTDAV